MSSPRGITIEGQVPENVVRLVRSRGATLVRALVAGIYAVQVGGCWTVVDAAGQQVRRTPWGPRYPTAIEGWPIGE